MRRWAPLPDMPPEPPLLTVAQAATYLGMGKGFVYDHSAQLGGRKVGSRLKFKQADLDVYLDRVQITEPAPLQIATARPPLRLTTSPVGKVTGHRYATTRQPMQSGGGR